MDRTSRFDMGAYAGFDLEPYVTRSLFSWDDAGWRSLLVQRFSHAVRVDHLTLPASTDHHLWLVTDGEGWMQTRAAGGWRASRISPGQLGMATPGEATHLRYGTTSPMRTIQVHLPARVVDRVSAQLGTSGHVTVPPDGATLGPVLRSLAAAAERGVDDLYAEAAAEFLAVHLLTGPDSLAAPRIPAHEDARVRKAVAVMRERLSEPLSLADIAGEVWLSTYHFLRVFKNATGQTPRRYLTRLRVEEAKRLLDRDMTVGEVADRCGFSSAAHLSAAFLRQTGVRPSAYRLR